LRRFLKIAGISILSLLVLIAATGWIISAFYEEEVKQFVIGELNKQLLTEIKVKQVDLSLFSRFPYASLEFTDISARSVKPSDGEKMTDEWGRDLLRAHKLSLQFNVFNIFSKKYNIKRIGIEQGEINILVSAKGAENYHFWKDGKGGGNESFQVKLSRIDLKNVQVRYHDLSEQVLVNVMVQKGIAKGDISEKEYEMGLEGELYVNNVKSGKTEFCSEKNAGIGLLLKVRDNKEFNFLEGTVRVADLNLDMGGKIVLRDSATTAFDLVIKGKEMNIQSVLSLLPAEYKRFSESYESDGDFDLEASIKGNVSKTEDPAVNAFFHIVNGEITEKQSGISLNSVNFKGEFSNGERHSLSSSSVRLEKFTANLKGGAVSGSLLVNDMEHPRIELDTKAKLDLAELKDFVKIDTLENLQGSAEVAIAFKGSVDAEKGFTAEDYRRAQTSGTIDLKEVSFIFKNSPHEFKNVNGNLLLNNNDIEVKNLKGKIMDSDFELNGFLRNVLSYLMVEGEKLSIEATLKSTEINLGQILASKETTKGDDTSYVFRLSDKVDFNFNTEIEKLTFQKFEATGIRGVITMKDRKLAFSPVHFTTMNGEVDAKGIIDATREKTFSVICDADLKHININSLFYQFESFGQQTLTEKNVKGYMDASVQFTSVWKNNLEVDEKSIRAKADIAINNGELNDFEPMQNLSRFIAVEELKRIKFSSLQNTVEIKDRTIIIPKMEIQSSALDVFCYGTHTFDNVIDYHFKLSLNELLSKKAKHSRKENDEFGVVEDDGLGRTSLFLTMKGTIDDPDIAYDRKGLKQNIKENMKEEKQNLKSLLNEEFGWFKKDSTIIHKKKKENGKFEIEWEEGKVKKEDPAKEKEGQVEKSLPKVQAGDKEKEEKKLKLKLLEKKAAEKKKKEEKEQNTDDFN
jgi:hypothetical protein